MSVDAAPAHLKAPKIFALSRHDEGHESAESKQEFHFFGLGLFSF